MTYDDRRAGARHRDLERPRPPWSRVALWAISALVVAIGAWVLFWPRAIEPPPAPVADAANTPQAAMRSATLYFGDRDGRTLVTERRDVPDATALETRIEVVVGALVHGPEIDGAVRTLPEGARLRRVFCDREAATAYLDFDPALVTRHPGGSTAEHATVAALVKTMGANFPEIVRVQILVDGQPVETVAGHFDTSRPLEIATWE
jgi:hypothetical protein